MDYATVVPAADLVVQSAAGVVRIVPNRPQKRDALRRDMIAHLDTALTHIAGDSAARVVVISVNGAAFCLGYDLGEMTGCSASEYRELFQRCSNVMMRLRRLPQPVVAPRLCRCKASFAGNKGRVFLVTRALTDHSATTRAST